MSRMKTMYCHQLGGPENCHEEFTAGTFEEIGELSKNHAMAMFQQGDESHINAGKAMQTLMADPGQMSEWMESKRTEFDNLPGD